MTDFEKGMRAACKLAAKTLNHVAKFVTVGVKTIDLDKIAHDFIVANGATPSPLGYRGYPKSICTSINRTLCHGVPDNTELKGGDIVNIDVTVYLNGYHGDHSKTYPVGQVSEKASKIIDAAYQSMMAGISVVKANGFTGDIGYASFKAAQKFGFITANGIGGHGVGRQFHMHPHVPGQGDPASGDILVAGTCITVEPIVMEKLSEVKVELIEGSQIHLFEAVDDILTAQFEHTVLVKKDGYEILTLE